MANAVQREELAGGVVRLSAAGARFEFQRPRRGVLVVTIAGVDNGQFGLTVLDEITTVLNRESALELFVDATDAVAAAVSVSDEWTRFFSTERNRLHRVHVLARSKAVRLTVAIAQHLSRTGDLVRIYSDPQVFQSRLAAATT